MYGPILQDVGSASLDQGHATQRKKTYYPVVNYDQRVGVMPGYHPDDTHIYYSHPENLHMAIKTNQKQELPNNKHCNTNTFINKRYINKNCAKP